MRLSRRSFLPFRKRPALRRLAIGQVYLNSRSPIGAEAHNYPEDMDFTLTRPQINQIARYMVTLRKAGYVPDK